MSSKDDLFPFGRKTPAGTCTPGVCGAVANGGRHRATASRWPVAAARRIARALRESPLNRWWMHPDLWGAD